MLERLAAAALFAFGVSGKVETNQQIIQEAFTTCWNEGHGGLEEAHLDLHVRLREIPGDLSRSWLMLEDLESGKKVYLVDVPTSVTAFNYTAHQGDERWIDYYLKPDTEIRIWVYENHDNHPGAISESILTIESCLFE